MFLLVSKLSFYLTCAIFLDSMLFLVRAVRKHFGIVLSKLIRCKGSTPPSKNKIRLVIGYDLALFVVLACRFRPICACLYLVYRCFLNFDLTALSGRVLKY